MKKNLLGKHWSWRPKILLHSYRQGPKFCFQPWAFFLSEIFDFYPENRYRYQFIYNDTITEPYLDELTDYFDKKRQDFDLPLDFGNLGTPLQQRVWTEIQKIPYGQTITYKQLAENVGNKKKR